MKVSHFSGVMLVLGCTWLQAHAGWTCTDNNDALTAANGMTCSQVSTTQCLDAFYAAHCPVTCGACNLPCVDMPQVLDCSAEQCTDAVNGVVYQHFCPETCQSSRCNWCQDSSNVETTMGTTCANLLSQCDTNALVAAYCAQSCQKCDLGCQDHPETLQRSGFLGCELSRCSDPYVGLVFQLFCPITCGQCDPDQGCGDYDTELTASTGTTCAEVASGGLCNDPHYAGYCPSTCKLCGKFCEDTTFVVNEYFSQPSCTAAMCTDQDNSIPFQTFCRATCKGCTPTPSASPSMSPSPSPSQSTIPGCFNSEDALLETANNPGSCARVVSLGLCGIYGPYCAKDCFGCNRPCEDTVSSAFNCTNSFSVCDDPTIGIIVEFYCPLKCGLCTPSTSVSPSPLPSPTTGDYECQDYDNFANQYFGMSCVNVAAQGLCTETLVKGNCPNACHVCNRPCEDDDSLLLSGYAGPCSAGACANMFLYPLYNYYCPITCGICSATIFPMCSNGGSSKVPMKFLKGLGASLAAPLGDLCL